MHYEILDATRRALLPKLATFKDRFYLAGGTALALQIGHRDSIDFDFFTHENFDTGALYAECERIFTGDVVQRIQDEKNTLGILVNNVQVSFMTYPYELVAPLEEEESLKLASLQDIACMKLSAITSRSTLKDFVDIYFLLRRFDLQALLTHVSKKLPDLDHNLVLKSLVYFEDISKDPIKYMSGHEVAFETMCEKLRSAVQNYSHS